MSSQLVDSSFSSSPKPPSRKNDEGSKDRPTPTSSNSFPSRPSPSSPPVLTSASCPSAPVLQTSCSSPSSPSDPAFSPVAERAPRPYLKLTSLRQDSRPIYTSRQEGTSNVGFPVRQISPSLSSSSSSSSSSPSSSSTRPTLLNLRRAKEVGAKEGISEPKFYSLHCSGIRRDYGGRPGSACSLLLHDEAGRLVTTRSIYLGDRMSTSEAIYHSIVQGMYIAHKTGAKDLKVYAESKYVVDRVAGDAGVYAESLASRQRLITRMVSLFRNLRVYCDMDENTIKAQAQTDSAIVRERNDAGKTQQLLYTDDEIETSIRDATFAEQPKE